MVEGYHLFVGGGWGAEQGIGRRLIDSLPFDDDPADRRAPARGTTWPTATAPTSRSPRSPAASASKRSAPSPTPDARRPSLDPHSPTGLRRTMDISLIPESAPFTPEQRAWLNGFLAGWLGLKPRSRAGPGRLAGRRPPPIAAPDAEAGARTLARPGPADRRAAEARRGQAPAAPADGRDGPARLRRLRLPLPDLLRGHRQRRGDAPDPLLARRLRDRRRPSSGSSRKRGQRRQRHRQWRRRTNGVTAERLPRTAGRARTRYTARLLRTRQPEPARLGEGDAARRDRPGRRRPDLRGRRLARRLPRELRRRSSTT